jgi:Fe-S-cluster containining protein
MSAAKFTEDIIRQVAELYQDMEEKYDEVAQQLDFSCNGCPDNCCDSYFLHHTYTEWAYLWEGLMALPPERLEELKRRSTEVISASERILSQGERPTVMCPLNDDGRCTLYKHRLMICRLHGVPSAMTRPDGKKMEFPGCFRCQEIVGARDVVHLDRTEMYKRLIQLEMEWLGPKRTILPKVKLTIAQMIVKGAPHLTYC